jgi:hypothetical protein
MSLHRSVWATVATTALTVGAVVAVPASAAAEPDRDHAVCSSRACLVVLDARRDKDGDGVADVDEAMLDTDAGDAASLPEPAKLLDLVIRRELPSFERRFTELVVLPTVTPDGSALATGLGEFTLRDGDANLLESIGVVVDEVGRNGFDAVFGLRVSASRETPTYPFGLSPLSASSGVGPDPGPSPEALRLAAWMIGNDVALYSAGSSGTITDHGHNAGKDPVGTTLGSEGRPYMHINSPTNVDKTWDVHYADGSRDAVTQSYSNGSDGVVTSQSVDSYGPDGSFLGFAYAERRQWTEPSGTKVTTVEYSAPTRDAEGRINGRQNVNVRVEQKTDGTTTTTIKTTNKDLDGNVISEKESTYVDDPECDAACMDEIDTEAGGDDYTDPEYIGFDIVTPEDLARVEFRLKQVGQPGPDDGSTGDHEPDRGMFGQCWPNCTADPLVVLMDPDGVTVFAAAEPNFNRWVQPDYDPWVQEMAGLADQKVPATGEDNPNTDGS